MNKSKFLLGGCFIWRDQNGSEMSYKYITLRSNVNGYIEKCYEKEFLIPQAYAYVSEITDQGFFFRPVGDRTSERISTDQYILFSELEEDISNSK